MWLTYNDHVINFKKLIMWLTYNDHVINLRQLAFFSSSPFGQSESPSHVHNLDIHLPLSHLNSSFLHVLLGLTKMKTKLSKVTFCLKVEKKQVFLYKCKLMLIRKDILFSIHCITGGWMYVIIRSQFVPLESKFLLIALVIIRITLNVIVRQMPLHVC